MKRRGKLLFALLCLLALSCGEGACAEAAGGMNAVCVDGERAYLLEGGALWLLDDELQPTEQLHHFTQDLQGFCARDGAFYFAFGSGEKIRFARLTADNRLEGLFDVAAESALEEILVIDDTVIALWRYMPQEEAQHAFINNRRATAYTLTGEAVALPFDEAEHVASSQQYGLLYTVFEATGTRLCTADIAGGAVRELGVPGWIDAMAEAPDGKGLYFDDHDRLCLYDYASGTTEALTLWEDVGSRAGMALAGGRAFHYALRGDMRLQTFDVDYVEKEKLTIVNMRGVGEVERQAIREFEREHPGVKVKMEEVPEAQLLAMLMSGDADVDILALQLYEVPRFVEAGALLDLNSDEVLGKRLEQGFAGSRMYVWDGVRYGVPDYYGAFVPCIRANESLAAYAPEIDWENATWLELFRQAEQMQTDITGDGVPDIRFIDQTLYWPTWLKQYLASFERPEQITFDTEEFRALAQQYRRCVQKGVIVHWADLEDADSSVLFRESSVFVGDGTPFLPLPGVNGRRVSPGAGVVFSVYVRSGHRELALDWLKCYTSDELLGIDDWPQIGCAMNSAVYSAYANFGEEQRRNVENAKRYIDETGVPAHDFGIGDFVGEQMRRYIEGDIPLDALVNSLQQKLQMARMG